jgi:hypothetical protein
MLTASLTDAEAKSHGPTTRAPVVIKLRVRYRQDNNAEDSLGD